MSISGGMSRAVERAEQVGATALQVFVKSARQWTPKPLKIEEVDRFRAALDLHGLQPYTLAHSTYLINLASPDPSVWERSVVALGEELDRCERLGIPMLVLHPGSHVGSGERAGLQRVVQGLDRLLVAQSGVSVLIETTAGQGTNLGHRFEQIGWILEQARSPERLGVCFDTCHVLAAGYDLRDEPGYRRTFEQFDEVIGLDRLRAFHLNDSKHELGSRKDRHEHIGRGHVGVEAFRLLVNDRRFRKLPMVLETPKGEDLDDDRRNLALLRELSDARASGR